MKKITILLLSLISTVMLGGCENNPGAVMDANLKSHLDTLDDLDTYTIGFTSEKSINNEETALSKFIYVDNVNDTFAVSVYDKEEYSIVNTDLVFEHKGDKLYNYVYNNGWIKHEIDSSFMNIVDFESAVFEYFKNATTKEIGDNVIYTAHMSLNKIKDSGYTIFGNQISEEYYYLDIPLTITYNKTEERFTNFDFDFAPIVEAMNVSEGRTTQESDYWNISFEFTKLNESFEVVISEYVVDDFINDFEGETFTGITELNSFDLITGCVDYHEDQDLLKVNFEDSGLYQLSLRSFEEVDDIVVTILDSEHNIFRTFILNSEDSATSYWNYTKGTYYVLVSGNLTECTSADYSLLFMSN